MNCGPVFSRSSGNVVALSIVITDEGNALIRSRIQVAAFDVVEAA